MSSCDQAGCRKNEPIGAQDVAQNLIREDRQREHKEREDRDAMDDIAARIARDKSMPVAKAFHGRDQKRNEDRDDVEPAAIYQRQRVHRASGARPARLPPQHRR